MTVHQPDMFDFGKRVAQRRQLDAKIKEIKAQHKEQLKPYTEALDMLDAVLLDALNKSGQQNAKTLSGTVYITRKHTASLEDAQVFMDFVIEHELWELLDRKANSTAVTDFLEANKKLPPGVKYNTIVDIGVLAPEKKR